MSFGFWIYLVGVGVGAVVGGCLIWKGKFMLRTVAVIMFLIALGSLGIGALVDPAWLPDVFGVGTGEIVGVCSSCGAEWDSTYCGDCGSFVNWEG